MGNNEMVIETPGSIGGFTRVGTSPFCRCGYRVGFSFGGFIVPQREAKKLAIMWLEKLEGITKSEEEQYEEMRIAERKYIEEYYKNNPPPSVKPQDKKWWQIFK